MVEVKTKTYVCPDKPVALFLKDDKWGYLSETGSVYLSGKKIIDDPTLCGGTCVSVTSDGNVYILSPDGIHFLILSLRSFPSESSLRERSFCAGEMKKSKDSISCSSMCLDKSGTIYVISKGDILRKVDDTFEKVIVGGFDADAIYKSKQRYQLGYDYKKDMLMILDCRRNKLFWYKKMGSYCDVMDLSFMRIIDGGKICVASAFDCDRRGKIVVGYYGGFIRVFDESLLGTFPAGNSFGSFPTGNTLIKCRASVRDIKLSERGDIYASYFDTNEVDVFSFEVFSSLSSSSESVIESF